MELRVTAVDLAALQRGLFARAPAEAAAFLAVEPADSALVLRSFRVFTDEEYEAVSVELSVTEESQVAQLAALKRAGHAVVEVHTHPGAGRGVGFSLFDKEQLPRFARYVRLKLKGAPFGALVMSEEGYSGRVWTDTGVEPLTIHPVGQRMAIPDWANRPSHRSDSRANHRFDRQVRALGADGQARIQALRVGVVGLGGTGSVVVQQLAHLGVRHYVLVEDDLVEASNVSRLAGATRWDPLLRRRKTTVTRRTIRRLLGRVEVDSPGALRTRTALAALRDVDVIIGCVDNDGARLVMSELAAANLVPYLDIGVGIEGEVPSESMGGRVSFYLPGGPCLACADDLDFDEAAEDLESEALRNIRVERGYARERGVEPALMPLNGAVASLAMMELLAFATGVRPVIPFSRYDAMQGRLIPQSVGLNQECVVCLPANGMGNRQRVERYAVAEAK